MDKPLVSVVITTHNRLSDFKSALNSVVNQSYKYLEIIVVDNASDNTTKEFLSKLQDIKILSIQNFVNGNLARNKGIYCARGKYIAFLDDDDEWDNSKVERQVQSLEQSDDCGLSYTGMSKVYDHKYSVDSSPNSYYTGDLSKKIFESIFTNTSTLMVERALLYDEDIFFDEQLTHWQEYDLLVRLSLVTKFTNIPEALTIININSTSKTRLSNQFNKWQHATKYFYSKYEQRISELDSRTIKMMKINYVNDAITRLDNKKNVYWKKSKYIVQKILLTKNLRSTVYLIPGITINTIREKSNKSK